MQACRSTWPGKLPAIGAFAVLAICSVGGVANSATVDKERTQPLQKKIVAAWKKAGAQVGWIHRGQDFGVIQLLPENEGMSGDLPAFEFSSWKPGALDSLPAPQAAFGLFFFKTEVTDQRLKELARFKNLQSLYLGYTEVTDAGLKKLARIKTLRSLDLSCTKVTGAG